VLELIQHLPDLHRVRVALLERTVQQSEQHLQVPVKFVLLEHIPPLDLRPVRIAVLELTVQQLEQTLLHFVLIALQELILQHLVQVLAQFVLRGQTALQDQLLAN